jgi:biopolymer transport protein ExbD
MGMSTGGGDKTGVQSSINVTPLIDVLLVLLIIFLVVMPIMVKMETLEIPPKAFDSIHVSELSPLTVKLKAGGDLVFTENDKEAPLLADDLLRTLRPRLEASAARGLDRVVFVDFDEVVPWMNVVATMDSIRGLADDVNHDGVKVALKVKDPPKPQ